MRHLKPAGLLRLGAGTLLVAALVTGCAASNATLRFECERQINDGLLLTVDIVQVTDREEEEIRQVGDDWFYSDLRRQLGARTQTVGAEGGCRETVVLRPLKGYDRLAVIADYQFEGRQTRAQMEFRDWEGTTIRVRVGNRHLTITRSG